MRTAFANPAVIGYSLRVTKHRANKEADHGMDSDDLVEFETFL